MLGQRRRRLSNIESTLVQYFVFAKSRFSHIAPYIHLHYIELISQTLGQPCTNSYYNFI